jgi:hypothetical protein
MPTTSDTSSRTSLVRLDSLCSRYTCKTCEFELFLEGHIARELTALLLEGRAPTTRLVTGKPLFNPTAIPEDDMLLNYPVDVVTLASSVDNAAMRAKTFSVKNEQC